MADTTFVYAVILTALAAVFGQVLNWVFEPAFQHASRSQDGSNRNDELFNPEGFRGSKDNLVDVSIVVPAYNEQERLPVMMDRTLAFMDAWVAGTEGKGATKRIGSYEIIVVDDGSQDDTSEVVRGYMEGRTQVRLFKLGKNVGKGGALKRGVQASLGHYVLIADADAATEIADLVALFNRVTDLEKQGNPIALAIGSRAHLRDSSVQVRAWYRTVLMYGFHVAVRLLCSANIQDTQCGFKLFTRKAAKLLFRTLHLERWAFDVEIIYVAERLNFPIAEEQVVWEEVPGSKLIQGKWDVVTTSLTMARDMLCVRLCYMLGIWPVPRLR